MSEKITHVSGDDESVGSASAKTMTNAAAAAKAAAGSAAGCAANAATGAAANAPGNVAANINAAADRADDITASPQAQPSHGTDGLPLLGHTDWNEEWMSLQARRRKPDDPSYWNGRAHDFPADTKVGPYAKRFVELTGIREGETVFDMGCGTGAIALPLGLAGHKVVAADFSRNMLDRMSFVMEQAGVKTVFPKLLSWDEDWAAKGVREGMVDVCVASRSIATANLRDSLLRLTEVARRRVCITLTTGSSPRTDEAIMSALGLEDSLCRDYLYAINILAAEGLLPRVDYIRSQRFDTYDSPEEAAAQLRRMIDGAVGVAEDAAARAAAYARLDTWLADNLIANDEAGQPDVHGNPQKALRLANPRVITWAFISWDK